MAKRPETRKGIFCLETHEWYSPKEIKGKIDNSSVEPSLMLLEKLEDYNVPYRRRDVATEEEFMYLLDQYLDDEYENYPILYLSFHGYGPENGDSSGIYLGNETELSLGDLETEINGRCRRRVIHFGACGVMSASDERLRSFRKKTGAIAVCGYTEDVNWLESAAFDLLLMGCLQGAAFNQGDIREKVNALKKRAPGLNANLGFKVVDDHGMY